MPQCRFLVFQNLFSDSTDSKKLICFLSISVYVHIIVCVTIVRHTVLQCDMEVLQQTPWSAFQSLSFSWTHSPNCACAPPSTLLAESCVASQEKNLPLQILLPTQLPT